MNVLVWGLGYVGTVSAACFARMGHNITGIDPNLTKVQTLNSGRSAIKEPGLENLIDEAVKAGRLRAVEKGTNLLNQAEISLICVGTPSAADGSPVLDFIRNVAVDIGRGLRNTNSYHVVVLRSTVFPGTTRAVLGSLIEEHSGLKLDSDFGLVANPEFLRETSAIRDFYAPPYTIIGAYNERSGDVVEQLYEDIDAPVLRVVPEEAELLKLVNNSFHGLKIGFANEIGRICERLGINSHAIMQMVCADTKLNISKAYMKPGFAFGGSCLPKDIRSISYNAQRLGAKVPILDAILPSNNIQVEEALIKIQEMRVKRVGVLGLSFKPDTDDLRESPMITLIRHLWQDGIDVLVHDPDVQPELMLGGNKEYLERQLPQINQILRAKIEDVLDDCQVIVVSQKRPEFEEALRGLNGKAAILDLEHLIDEPAELGISKYCGISW